MYWNWRDVLLVNRALISYMLEVSIPHKPEELGYGSYGCAFDIGNGLVIKVSTDDKELKAANRLVGKNLRNVYKIHAVIIVDGFYLILQEKLEELSDDERRVFGLLQSRRANLSQTAERLITDRNHRSHGVSEAEWIYTVDKACKSLICGLNALYRHKINHTDYHEYNIMKTDRGRYKLIDVRTRT